MNQMELFETIGLVDDDLVDGARTAMRRKPALRLVALRWSAVAACLALIVGIGVQRSASLPQLAPEQSPTARSDIAMFSAMGMRKFLNYNGFRYAFLSDGAPYDLSAFSLSDSLGALEYDIMAGMGGEGSDFAETDFATTYALGGTLHEISGYRAEFRLAVSLDGEWYLAELVGRVDNTPLDPEYYWQVSNLQSLVREVHIRGHMGGDSLYVLQKKKEAANLVRSLGNIFATRLESADYEAMAAAQTEGRSWQLELSLADGTAVCMYMIPDLRLLSLGDSTYTLPDTFVEEYGSLFESLSQDPLPLY